MAVKLSGSLPEFDRNGMYQIQGELVKHPDTRHLVVMVVDCASTTIKYGGDEDQYIPTAGIVFVEPIRDRDDINDITEIMARVRAERLSNGTLDFDFGIEDPLAEAAKAMRDAGVTVVSFNRGDQADAESGPE